MGFTPLAKPSQNELSKRRTHSPEFKSRVAIEAISGRKTLQEIAAGYLGGIKDLLVQVVLLEQMLEAENRCLNRNLVADQIYSCKALGNAAAKKNQGGDAKTGPPALRLTPEPQLD